MICLNDLFSAGNALRLAEGKSALQIFSFLSQKGVEEYIAAAAEEWQLPREAFIRMTGKGRNSLTMAHVSVAMLAAEHLNARFHAHVHRVFLEGKLLEFRMLGGTEFKSLNAAIDSFLPGREGKESNQGVFITVAKLLRTKILGPEATTDSWNTCGVAATHVRYSLESYLCTALRLGHIRDFEHLKETIQKL